MQKGREAAKGVGSVASTVQGALDAIFADLNSTVQFATTFAAETENQTKRMHEVLRRMEEVAAIADGAATGARQTSAATAQQLRPSGSSRRRRSIFPMRPRRCRGRSAASA